jgi:Uma2 family endonuclease
MTGYVPEPVHRRRSTVADYHRLRFRIPPQAGDVFLLIEVADMGLMAGRDIKVPLYTRHNIPEVWIVDIVHRQVLRYADPAGGAYHVQGGI